MSLLYFMSLRDMFILDVSRLDMSYVDIVTRLVTDVNIFFEKNF